jgi:RNA polymerase sigma-70 factor (ECF subfamily)
VHPTDADLLRSAGRGDDRAFHTLVDRHAGALYQVALSYARNRADAEDLVQETLVAAFRGAGGFAGRSSVRTWMLQILNREAARAWRKAKRRRGTLSLDSPTAQATGGASHDPALSSPAPSDRVEQRMDITDILADLSEPHREVLVMREIWDLSYEEIAQALNVPRGTVESRLSRAREQFRRRFLKED